MINIIKINSEKIIPEDSLKVNKDYFETTAQKM